jgi:Pvc16 N-terminal domain
MADELTIIRDVGNTLKELLETNIPTLRTNVSFNSPAEMQTPAGNRGRLSLFLYQVSENIHMRNRDSARPDPDRLVYPPVILDFYYLLTPYAQEREDEFDLLERVVRVLYDNAVLKGSALKGMLLDSGNEVLRIASNPLSLEDLNHLWNTFSKPFKISVAYLVTPVSIPSIREFGVQPVIQKETRYYQIVRAERGQ